MKIISGTSEHLELSDGKRLLDLYSCKFGGDDFLFAQGIVRSIGEDLVKGKNSHAHHTWTLFWHKIRQYPEMFRDLQALFQSHYAE